MPIAATTQRPAAVVRPRTETLPDDRPGAEEADAVTIWAAIRVGSKTTPSAVEELEVAPPVGRDDREERRADADEHVRPEPGRTVAQLALEADRAREGGGDQEPDEDVPPFDLGNHATASFCFTPISPMPDVARSTSASSSSRVNGTRSAVACTSISRPSRS